MTGNAGFSTQLVTGTAIGYRWWDLWLDGPGPRFGYYPSIIPPALCGAWAAWQPGENKASCLKPTIPPLVLSVHAWTPVKPVKHIAPDGSCHCGYWAFWDKPLYWRTAPGIDSVPGPDIALVPVLGVAEGWGRTLKGSLGFRCEYAKVTALLAPPAYKNLLSQLQPQAMIYTNPRALFAEHPAGIMGNNTE